MIMEIHPYGTPHHLIHDRNHIFLEPGSFTYIGLEQKITHYLPKPHRPHCHESEYKIIKDYGYSKEMCEIDCLLEQHLQKCKCVADEFKEYVIDNVRICNITEMQCTFVVMRDSDSKCRDCAPNCHFNQYDVVKKSRLNIGNQVFVKKFRRHQSHKKNRTISNFEANSGIDNIVAVRVAMNSLAITEVTYRVAVPWFDRLSLLGGTMGLLLGFSILSAVEFVFFVCDYAYTTTPMFARRLKQNRITH